MYHCIEPVSENADKTFSADGTIPPAQTAKFLRFHCVAGLVIFCYALKGFDKKIVLLLIKHLRRRLSFNCLTFEVKQKAFTKQKISQPVKRRTSVVWIFARGLVLAGHYG